MGFTLTTLCTNNTADVPPPWVEHSGAYQYFCIPAVLGNHDYKGNVSAQLGRELAARNPYWFCDRSFRVRQGLCAKAKGTPPLLIVQVRFATLHIAGMPSRVLEGF